MLKSENNIVFKYCVADLSLIKLISKFAINRWREIWDAKLDKLFPPERIHQ